jgi:hypothetical protein
MNFGIVFLVILYDVHRVVSGPSITDNYVVTEVIASQEAGDVLLLVVTTDCNYDVHLPGPRTIYLMII